MKRYCCTVTSSGCHAYLGDNLSGTLQGAGGVGGLVAVSIGGQYYFPCYDNLGNVVAYVDENGSKVAMYTYDAFGNTLSSSGSMRYAFPHRFSTKYCDEATGLCYYGYRFYSPELGRWMNRDPIGEYGGINIYVDCINNLCSSFDCYGLMWAFRDLDPRCTNWTRIMDHNLQITRLAEANAAILHDPSLTQMVKVIGNVAKGDALGQILYLSKDLELWANIAEKSSLKMLFNIYDGATLDNYLLPETFFDFLCDELQMSFKDVLNEKFMDSLDSFERTECEHAIKKMNLYLFAEKEAYKYMSISSNNDKLFADTCPCSYRTNKKAYIGMRNSWKKVYAKLENSYNEAKNEFCEKCLGGYIPDDDMKMRPLPYFSHE